MKQMEIVSAMKRNMRWLMGAWLICGLWMFVACANEDSPAVVPVMEQLQDGEWTGSGEGRSGTIIVKVTVEDHQVAKVTVVSQSESSFAQETINSICESAVGRTEEMNVEVDGITGATLTSTGVIDAINMALEAAMGKPVGGDKIYKDGTCDIVVIGAGGAGLSAAVAAAETANNLKIIVLEKQGIIGGNTNNSTGGINAAETDVQKGLDIEDSKKLFYDDTMKGGKYENIPSLVENFVEHAPVTISWLTGLGADLSDVGLMGGSSVKRTHRPKGGAAIGPHLMKVLKEATSSKNIEIRTSNKVLDLLSAVDGSVTGVKVQNANGNTYRLTAKAVIIATGGFGANLEMVTSLQPSLKGFATLNRYNAQQKAGVDEDFGRSAAQLTAALETAPYYAVCVTPAIHHTMGGLSVNTSTQVLKADGTPIPGLYAAGEVTGGLHGANRLGGNGVADIVVNGRLAGIAAARMFARLDS